MRNTGLRNTPYALAGGGYRDIKPSDKLGLGLSEKSSGSMWTTGPSGWGSNTGSAPDSGVRLTAQRRLHKVGGALARGPIHTLGTLGTTVTEESGYDYACPIVGH